MKPARNDPCSCGSGKKYRHCCEGKVLPHSAAPSPDELNPLIALFNTRHYAELEGRARSLAGRYPGSGFAWKLLAASLQLQGKDALSACRKTAALMPNDADAHNNLGNALKDHEQFREAAASFHRALEIKPGSAVAHYNLGNVLKDLGQPGDAVASYRRALQIKPDFAEAYNNLGLALQELGQIEDALENYRWALQIKPDLAEAHNSLGLALRQLGQTEGALASYRRALQIKPDYAVAHNNLGIALRDNSQYQDALESFRRALQLAPRFAEAHSNLGITLRDISQYEAAAESFRRALEIKPDFVVALSNLGHALRSLGQFSSAEASFRRALEIDPNSAMAHLQLGNILIDLGQHNDAVASYRQALDIMPELTDARSNLLYLLNFIDGLAPSYYLEQARQYGRIVAAKVDKRFSAWQCAANPERLRVGLVSGDLRIHSVGNFLEGVLSHFDPARIELIAYPTQHKEDELTARIRPFFSAWRSLAGKSDEDAARLIHADGIHILLDVSQFTAHNRLPVFAWKPAPVQVTWLGLPVTTGVAEMDYVLGDAIAIPKEHEHHFSETVWRLPDSYLCFSAPTYPVNVAPLPALSAGHVTFGSFNNLTKMNDAVVALWARILLSVPNSHLYLKTVKLLDADIREQTLQRFAAWGIAPERLLLVGRIASIAEHLSEYDKIDIALDTFPYPGVTTSVEALWMGVPVLTLHGDRFLSLTATSVAHHAGLPDWVAADKDDYVTKAVAFTSNLERLAILRASLRQQVLASPLFDAPRFARNFEDALWGMWRAHNS